MERKDQKGIVLLYALLFMALITAMAIFVSIVIINELKLTSTAVDATLAYYAAESGIEKGLHTVKMNRGKGGETLGTTVTEIQGYSASNFDNRAKYDNEGTNQISGTIDDSLKKNEYVQIDFYNVDDPLADSGIRRVKVSGTSVNGEAWAEVSWTGWRNTGVWFSEPSAKKFIGPTNLAGGLDFELSMGTVPLAEIVGYRIRIKALFSNIEGLLVTPLNDNSQPLEEPSSQVVVKSVGNKGKFKQSLTAIVPWKVPLHGLYDYVLFSEEGLAKTIIVGREIYTSGAIQVEDDLPGDCIGCPHDFYDTCTNWQAVCCAEFSSCEVDASGWGMCTVNNTASTHWILPIPDSIPRADDYYLSLRMRGSGDMRVILGETCKELPAPGGSDWVSCTVPDADFSTFPNINLKFEQIGAGSIDVDWYQLSTYKIFDDCDSVTACAVPSPDCGNCICESGENCPEDVIDCADDTDSDGIVCKEPACTDGCQLVNVPDDTTDPECAMGEICCYDSGLLDTVCKTPNCSVDADCPDDDSNPCTVEACADGDTCSANCYIDQTITTCYDDIYGCCPLGCTPANDPDCVGLPDKEYLRYVAFDESGNSLASLNYPGKSMRGIPAWENQYSGAVYLRDVWAADVNNVWVVGASGTVLYSDDGGQTGSWVDRSPGGGYINRINGIIGFNTLDLLAVANGVDGSNILRSINGGSSWSFPSSGTGNDLNNIWAFDQNNIWAVGDNGTVLYSDDGGQTGSWVDRSPSGISGLGHLWDIFGISSLKIWAVGANSKVVYSDDGGLSWEDRSPSGGSIFYGVSGIDNDDGGELWVVNTLNGWIFHTADGGLSWDTQQVSGNPLALYDVVAYDEYGSTRVLAVGQSGNAYYNDGTSDEWTFQGGAGLGGTGIPGFATFRGVFAYDYDNIWGAGGNGGGAIARANLPGPQVTLSSGYNQYWYSRNFSSFDPPNGSYVANLYVSRNTTKNPWKVGVEMAMGYCDNGCDQAGDFTTWFSGVQTLIYGSSTGMVNVTLGNGDFSCPADCRLWYNLFVYSDTSPSGVDISLSGVDTQHSNIDIAGP